jgi:adenylate cyclase
VRRLRAIAAIDIAGYSKLMSIEEARTHARVNELFATTVKPVIDGWGGTQIERAGDGLLVLFESSTDAVRCALEIQQAVEQHEMASGPAHRLRLRIGVNVGDIIIDGDEIAGDDVNIAVRLQALAEPGTVCISASVRGQLHEELDGAFEDLGDVALKNIGKPVHVFQVRRRNERPRNRLSMVWRWQRRLRSRLALAGLLGVIVALALLAAAWPGLRSPAADELPPMSVAILAFRAPTGDATNVGEDAAIQLASALAATGWLDVRSHEYVLQAAGQSAEPAALRAALNVRYVVSGQLTRQSGQIGADVQLLDTANRAAIWTSRLSVADGPKAGTELAATLVVKVRQAVYDAEVKRFSDSKAVARTPMEHTILGDLQRRHRFSLDAERKARPHYERALELDPQFVPSMLSLAYVDLTEADLAPGPRTRWLIDSAEELSKRAVTQLAESAPGWQLRAEVLARQWLWDAALNASDRSLAIDPARAHAYGQRASIMVRLGRPEEALALTSQALSLAEQRFGYVQFQRCRALLAQGDYAGAVESCQRAISREDWWLQRAYLTAAYALLGDAERAAQEKGRLQQQLPQASIQHVLDLRESDTPAYRAQIEAHLLRGLRLAGVADKP